MGYFADLVQVLGIPKSVGQIYGLLFASPQPLGFTDIVGKLSISKGSASQGLQLLRALGAAKAIQVSHGQVMEGIRRELFEPELGLRRLVGGVLREKIEPLVRDGGVRLRRLSEVAKTDKVTRAFSEQRFKQIQIWRRQIRLLLPLLKSLFSPRL